MEPKSHKPRWNLWPICIISFFSMAVVGCVSFVIFCNLQRTDLVAADYYEQELGYQGQLDRMNRARELAGPAQIAYEAVRREITISLPPSAAGQPLTGRIQLYRPSAAGLDRELALQPTAEGKQSIDAATLDPGLWKVRVTWAAGAQEYYVDKSIVIAAKGL